ncbi:MAG: hydratase [Clostridiales bacterium]|nr:hydratase [Clostridiales bacterium]
MPITLHNGGAYYLNRERLILEDSGAVIAGEPAGAPTPGSLSPEQRKQARAGTMAHAILAAHNSGDDRSLKIRFDAIASHDITYVSIIQTARASGMKDFPLPFVLTNCHNSLCTVGGTINEDDHVFGLSAAKKYGGIFVPANVAVIHQYMREMMAGCGKMILSTDSHTRYGALGTMAMGEGGGELVKQLLRFTYDIQYPGIVAVYLKGRPVPGVGPQDVALAIVKAVYASGFVKNRVLEFIGPGIASLSMEFRIGVDVMMTETTCLSTIWETDERTQAYLQDHGRPEDYRRIVPQQAAYYDRALVLDLSRVRPMIALPFHPSNGFTIDTFNENTLDILHETDREIERLTGDQSFRLCDAVEDGRLRVRQGIIAGCSGGTYENLMEAARILRDKPRTADEFALSVYPASLPVQLDLIGKGALQELLAAGVTVKPSFCGPCFGIGDTPSNHTLSIRHSTRNFVAREGSLPEKGQLAAVALMDARSIAATCLNGGRITPATACVQEREVPEPHFDRRPYESRVIDGWSHKNPQEPLIRGANITDWPTFYPLEENVLLTVCARFDDRVTTTDDLLPSGEASSYRSNPQYLARFALSRRKPAYVEDSRAILALEQQRRQGTSSEADDALLRQIQSLPDCADLTWQDIERGSAVAGHLVGDGSAREQAVSSQRVLGGLANFAEEYATKRYFSNLTNWGVLPFVFDQIALLQEGSCVFVPGVRSAVERGQRELRAYLLNEQPQEITLRLPELKPLERKTLMHGCFINYCRMEGGQNT